MGKTGLLDFRSKTGVKLVAKFLGVKSSHPSYEVDEEDLAFHPCGEWVEYLYDDLKYDGYLYDDNIICIFEPYLVNLPVKLLGRQLLEVG